jgi:hypothetical protein
MINHNNFRYLYLVPLFFLLTGCKELAPYQEKLDPVVDKVKSVLGQDNQSATAGISTDQMAAAIKQALSQGVSDSVDLLGSLQGFDMASKYHIKLPTQLDKPAELLRKLGQGKKVDDMESRLNLAARQAVKEATPVFTDTIKSMTVEDALAIMKGQDDAATQYFRNRTESRLRTQFLPIITDATSQTGLTSAYKSLNTSINSVAPGSNKYTVDIDQYVLDNSMNALFDRVAIEEKLIREQPVKRTTELMKTVYGYFSK